MVEIKRRNDYIFVAHVILNIDKIFIWVFRVIHREYIIGYITFVHTFRVRYGVEKKVGGLRKRGADDGGEKGGRGCEIS